MKATPASSLQQRLWFLHQLSYPAPIYHVVAAYELLGSLKADELQSAVDLVVARHEALRTSIVRRDGAIVQEIHDRLPTPITHVRLDCASDTLRVERALREFSERPFELGFPPLVRALLIQVGPRHHVFCLVIHHVIIDGWSLAIVTHEIAEGYNAICSGGDPRINPRPVQFARYVEWTASRLQRHSIDDALTYWRGQFADASIATLPTSSSPTRSRGYHGALWTSVLDTHLETAIGELSRTARVTPFVIWLAAVSAVLSECVAGRQIVIGTAVANRSNVEFERVVGPFVNLLPLLIEDSRRISARDLARLRTVVIDALSHQQAPYEAIVRVARRESPASTLPLVKNLLLVEPETTRTRFRLDGLVVRPIRVIPRGAAFDLTLFVAGGATPELHIRYDSQIFAPGEIAHLGADIVRAMEEMLPPRG